MAIKPEFVWSPFILHWQIVHPTDVAILTNLPLSSLCRCRVAQLRTNENLSVLAERVSVRVLLNLSGNELHPRW